MNYLDKIDNTIKEYFQILEPDFPDWLTEYINTKELLKQQYISITCGTIYTDLFNTKFFYSSLDHSIAVALIIWHFTHEKKQTLSGLFHDIATPAFKHCVDFLNGDYMTQESTEDLTFEIILNSQEIMSLLKRDKIKIEEVCDYHKYPIADNDTPKLSSDRLEYSLSNALLTYNMVDMEEIKTMYSSIEVQLNEENEIELGFKDMNIALQFVELTSKLSIIYREDRTRYSMQFIADILKRLCDINLINKQDLYELKEKEIISIIEKSKYGKLLNIWKSATTVKISKQEPKNVYFVHVKSKVRYIDPIVNKNRISKICHNAKLMIEQNLSYNMTNFVYIDGIVF